MSRLCISLWFLLAIAIVHLASPVEIRESSMIAIHPTTRHLYIATDNSLLHMTANFTVLGNFSLQSLPNEEDKYEPRAIGIDEHRDTLLACWSYNGGQCAQFNATDIEDKQWCVSKNNECRVKSRSCLVFLGNNTVLVGSSVNKNTGQTAILSLRKLSPGPLKMTYSKGINQDSSIIMIEPECDHTVKFMTGFKWNEYVYFLTQQTNSEDKSDSTVLIRVNGNGRTIFPVNEITIDCLNISPQGIYQVTNDSIYARRKAQPFDPTVAMTFCGYKMSTLNDLLDGAAGGNNTLKPPWLCSPTSTCTKINHTCANSGRVRSPSTEKPLVFQLKPSTTGSALKLDPETLLVGRAEGNMTILTYYSGKFTKDDCRNKNKTDEARGPYYWCNDICTDNRSECLDIDDMGNSSFEDCGSSRHYENYTCEECSSNNSTKLPLYWCDGMCTSSSQCNQSCIFYKLEPRRGPTAQGRKITLHGCGLKNTTLKVTFGSARCALITSTNSTYTCVLKDYSGSLNDGEKASLPADEKLSYEDHGKYTCSSLVYTFESNPNITDISPNKTYQRGNANLTVIGEGFDLFSAVSMSIGYNGTNTSKTYCDIQNERLMYCLTSPIEADEVLVTASLYFQLENVQLTRPIRLYDTPSFDNQTEKIGETFKGGANLSISGKFDGVQKEDVHFTVASTECRYVEVAVNNTILVCGIDWDKLRAKGKSGKQTVFVSIKNVGNITFGIDINLGESDTVDLLLKKEVFIGVVAGGLALGLLLVCTCLGCLCCLRNKKKPKEIHIYQDTTSTRFDDKAYHTYFELRPKEKLPDETMQKIIDDQLMIPADRLKLGEQIGAGNFGCVYIGELLMDSQEESSETVAVKTIHEGNLDLKSFVEEALMMKEFHHKNVLQLLGIAVSEEHQPMVVLPFMANGDLLSYIVDDQKEMYLSTVLKWGIDIAEGMDYLSRLKLVHRDLAARNCMLDGNLCVKVADFGLSRDIYEQGMYTSDNKKKLPIRWMAPESMDRGVYTSKSDVWSLGVVLWELLTRGATPYPGVEGWDISRYIHRGRRLRQPWFCGGKLYDIMLEIWSLDPNQRPTFSTIAEMLTDLLQEEVMTQNLVDENITFPDCCRFVQLPSLDYFVLEPELAGREPAIEEMEPDVGLQQQSAFAEQML